MKTPITDSNAVFPASNDDSDKQSVNGTHVPVEVARDLEEQTERLRSALVNLRGWVVANTNKPIHSLLEATDAALSFSAERNSK